MKKRLIGLFFITLCILGLNSTPNRLTLSEEKLDQKVTQVLDSLWKEHGLLHYQIVKTDPNFYWHQYFKRYSRLAVCIRKETS
ncbi:hypothetical protein [Bacillus safensis]|uniref:hypothetical protein n=1 Tax=Bacillus safensis TaxID=561879 RepID=UPI0005ADA553|nr:hypothetical protein [Bacillus safensis]KIL14776.1 hypothetical protein B4107_3501 [Bacillus safensis]